jgi:chaperonin GroES
LFIPEKAQETLNEGIVVEVGPGLFVNGKLNPVAVAKGDRVLLPPFGGSQVKVGDEEFTLFKDSEILAKLQ